MNGSSQHVCFKIFVRMRILFQREFLFSSNRYLRQFKSRSKSKVSGSLDHLSDINQDRNSFQEFQGFVYLQFMLSAAEAIWESQL